MPDIDEELPKLSALPKGSHSTKRTEADTALNSKTQSDEMRPARDIILVIDVEPDARKVTAGLRGWESSEEAFDRLEELRERLAVATGRTVRFNWFFRCDPQIARAFGRADYVAEACPRVIAKAAEGEDAAGLHVHLWRWSDARASWYNDFNDRAWLEECVETSTTAFRNIFGYGARMSRFGDGWVSQQALDVVRAAGIEYDLTVEPGLRGGRIHDDPHATGSLPDLRDAPRQPYRPSPDNYLLPDDSTGSGEFWIVPATTTRPAWRLVRKAPWVMRASRSPNLVLTSGHVWPHLQAELDRPSQSPLVILFRSGDLAKPHFRRNFERTVGELGRHPALPWCEFTTPDRAIERWKAVGI